MRPPGLLVRTLYAHAFGNRFIFRRVGAHDTGQVVSVGDGNAALTRGHALDLITVAAFGVAGHTGDHAFEPFLCFGFVQVFGHRAKQAEVVGVRVQTNAKPTLVPGVTEFFVGVNSRFADLQLCRRPPRARGWKNQTTLWYRQLWLFRAVEKEWQRPALVTQSAETGLLLNPCCERRSRTALFRR